jgi:hypothetical protein
MNEPTKPAARVLLLAVRPLSKLADRANLVLSFLAVFSPLVLFALNLSWELVLLLVLAVALALVFWAAVRLQRESMAAQAPALRFDGIERGVPVRIDRRLDFAATGSRAYVRSARVIGDEEDPWLPLRARYVNDPPLRLAAARAESVWAELTFTDPAGNVEARIDRGRWAGEPQLGIDAPLTGPAPLSPRADAGLIDFPANGRPEALDVAIVRRNTGEIVAWDALQRPYVLSGREYAVGIVLRGSPVPDLETRLRLSVPDEGDPVLEEDAGGQGVSETER